MSLRHRRALSKATSLIRAHVIPRPFWCLVSLVMLIDIHGITLAVARLRQRQLRKFVNFSQRRGYYTKQKIPEKNIKTKQKTSSYAESMLVGKFAVARMTVYCYIVMSVSSRYGIIGSPPSRESSWQSYFHDSFVCPYFRID